MQLVIFTVCLFSGMNCVVDFEAHNDLSFVIDMAIHSRSISLTLISLIGLYVI